MSATTKYDNGALPEGWRLVRLGDVLSLQYGTSLPERDRKDGEVPVVGSAGVVGFHDTAVVKGPGIVVGRKGSIGSITWIAQDFVPIDTTYFLTPVDGQIDLRWAYYELSRESLSKLNRATGIPGLNRDDVLALERCIPPLHEQRAIAAVLDSIDDAIEQTVAVIAATEQLRDSLLHQLLTRGIPGQHAEWKDVPGLGTIPADWEVLRLEEVATVERGKFAHRPRNESRFYGGEIPFIQTGDVVKATGQILEHSQTLNELGLSISRLFPTGTIIITIAANIGETAIASYPVAFPDSLVGITPGALEASFLEYFLRTRKAYLNELAPESAQKNINLEDLRPLLTPLPSRNEQQAIAATLNGVGAAVDVAQQELQGLRLLKESTADALLTGRVRIDDGIWRQR